jgi:hypothetical protein
MANIPSGLQNCGSDVEDIYLGELGKGDNMLIYIRRK